MAPRRSRSGSRSKSRSKSRGRGKDRSRSRGRSERSRRRRPARSRSRGRSRSRSRGREKRSRSPGRNNRRGNTSATPVSQRSHTVTKLEHTRKSFMVTPEQRGNAVEFQGHLYATIDFYPPDVAAEELSTQKDLKSLPDGWELVPKEQPVLDEVIKIRGWSTHYMVLSEGEAIWTARGTNPGRIHMIWDLEKSGRLYRPSQRGALKNYKGRVLIRTKEPIPQQ